MIVVELTVPWEENETKAALRKENRYHDLIKELSVNWDTHYYTIEIGCRGYCSQSLIKCLRELGIPHTATKNAREKIIDTVQRCSYIIWCKRNSQDWTDPVMKIPSP